MMKTFNRTRFLSEIDRMLMRDRRGAIDDMLQVLRECGAIKEARVEVPMDRRFEGDQNYQDSRKRIAADHIGRLLLETEALSFRDGAVAPGYPTFQPEYPTFQKDLIGTAFFVADGAK
ncbi:hypothetical protein NKJ09_22580 [Mesorhizobium sp. M0189]|uniref:hypothetical protein n=1 Tax=Mesorhizobium sp. M0189 TaxID=2956909 RepID=UPI0033360D2B